MGSTGSESETTFIWDGSNIVAELNGNAVTSRYVRGIGLILSDGVEGQKFYLYNGHGDVVQLAGTNGAILWLYDYDAFGNEREIAGQDSSIDSNPFRYCGEYFDKETGTIYLRARYYSPVLGRFRAEDPIRDGLNWYIYYNGNPVFYIDPSGLAVTPWDIANVTNSNDQKQLLTNTLIWDNPNSTQKQKDDAAASSKAIRAKYMSPGQTQQSNGYVITTPSISAPSTSASQNKSTPNSPIVMLGVVGGSATATNNATTNLLVLGAAATLVIGAEQHRENQQVIDLFAKGGKQNLKSREFEDVSDSELDTLYRDPNTSSEQKQKIKKEQKARGTRHSTKRK